MQHICSLYEDGGGLAATVVTHLCALSAATTTRAVQLCVFTRPEYGVWSVLARALHQLG